MANLKKQLFQKENLLVIFLLLLANVGWFWKFYFQNLLPFPGDLLVSFFFPWNSGGFIGFDQWTTHKDVIAADVIRQMYPWKQFAFELIKHGQFPLWNPFNFSGYPLIANLQSSVFFPGNLLFLFLPTLWAWIGNVVYLPLIMSLFTYLFLRSLKLSRLAACFGAIVSINLGYIVVWHEQLIITQVAMFLPASLWTVNLYLNSKKPIYLLLTSLFLAFAIFGGHAQTFIYLLIILTAYMWLVKIPRIYLLALILFSFALGAVQLFPTMEIYLHSAREGQATRELFAPFILPWQNLATILAPDFFGSPATNNFWGKQYGDFQVYFGVVAAIFSLIGAVNLFKDRVVKLFILLGFAGLLFAVYPLVYLPHVLNIPILATGVPARIIFIFQFASMVLAAYGFDFIARSEKKSKT